MIHINDFKENVLGWGLFIIFCVVSVFLMLSLYDGAYRVRAYISGEKPHVSDAEIRYSDRYTYVSLEYPPYDSDVNIVELSQIDDEIYFRVDVCNYTKDVVIMLNGKVAVNNKGSVSYGDLFGYTYLKQSFFVDLTFEGQESDNEYSFLMQTGKVYNIDIIAGDEKETYKFMAVKHI